MNAPGLRAPAKQRQRTGKAAATTKKAAATIKKVGANANGSNYTSDSYW
jgi:hypothetical protein